MGFSGASQFVRPEDVAQQIPCGPDLDAVVEAVRPWWEAGFTDVALVQVGGEHQQAFLDEAAGPLLEKLRKAAPTHLSPSRVLGWPPGQPSEHPTRRFGRQWAPEPPGGRGPAARSRFTTVTTGDDERRRRRGR